jgi:DNA-directed RNA polymerase subunit N (RpoN/RPB10)
MVAMRHKGTLIQQINRQQAKRLAIVTVIGLGWSRYQDNQSFSNEEVKGALRSFNRIGCDRRCCRGSFLLA